MPTSRRRLGHMAAVSRGSLPHLAAVRRRPWRAAAAALMMAALAGCATGVQMTAPNRANVWIGGTSVAIAAPAGFCIDEAATATNTNGAFALLTDCGLLGHEGGRTPPVAAMMTASISARPEPVAAGNTPIDDLEAFLDTSRGRAVLGRSGSAEATRILQSTRRNDVLYVLVEDRGSSPIPGVEPRFWRAFMTVDGRLAALTIQSFEGAGPDLQESLRHLAGFATALRATNPAG